MTKTADEYTINGLKSNSDYDISISAKDEAGNSEKSDKIRVVTLLKKPYGLYA